MERITFVAKDLKSFCNQGVVGEDISLFRLVRELPDGRYGIWSKENDIKTLVGVVVKKGKEEVYQF